MSLRRFQRFGCGFFVACAFSTGGSVSAQDAVFVIEGTFLVGDIQDFTFDLSRNVDSTETLQFQTVTPGSGIVFDSVLEVFDAGGASQGFNDDDLTGGSLNSLLSWASLGAGGNPLTDPLVAGTNYRLRLNEFNNDQAGSWETRIFAPTDAFTLTNASPSGTGTINSIRVEANGGAGTAVFNNSTNLTITDTLNLANFGNATLNHSLNTLTVGGITTVNAGGTLNLTTGTINLNGNANFNGGTLTKLGGTLNLAAGKTLTATNNATISFSGNHVLNNGVTFDIQSGSDLTVGTFLDIGSNTTGTLIVDGSGSSLTATNLDNFWGVDGGTANVTIRNGATATLAGIELVRNQVANTNGTWDILSGAVVTAGTILVAADGPVTGGGTITVDGISSSLAQNGASTLTLGHATNGTATVNVQNSGSFTTGSGATTINATGTVDINTGGTFNAQGPVNVVGGTINRNGGNFILAPGQTLTASNNAQINFTNGSHLLTTGNTFDIQGGADFFANGLDIGSADAGTLIVDGLGSTLTVDAAPAFWGLSGGTATVTLRNDAMATISANTIHLARLGNNSTGTINVESGADMTTNDLLLADDSLSAIGTTATINVTGAGSTLTQNGTSLLTVGGTGAGSTATINIGSFTNTFTTGTGAVNINANGTISMTGGTFNANGLTTIRGTVTKTAGTLNLNQDTTVDGGLLQRIGGAVNIAASKKIRAINNGQVNFSGFYSLNNGASIEIESGSDLIVGSFLDVGDTTNGNLIVDGSGSSLTAGLGIPSIWGVSGGTADVTIRNSALATLGSLKLADGTTAGSSAVLRIQSGASVTADNIEIADNGPTAGTGTLTVDGAGSTLTQNGAATFTVGHATTGAATVNVQNAGTFLTGTGTTTINATGTVNTDATFLVKGSLNIVGGTLNHSGGLFNIGAGKTLTATNNATITFNGNYGLSSGVTFDIQSGSDLSAGTFLDIGAGGTAATLIVDGSGSSLSTGTNSLWGANGGTANVTIRNQATAALGGIELVQNQAANTNGTWDILGDATVTAGTIRVAADGPVTGGGTVTVDGTNSSLTQNGASTLTLGHATNGTATLNISNAGTFTTGTGATTVNATGTLNVNAGGTLFANGPFNIVGGTLTGNGTLFASQGVNNAGNLIPQSTSTDGVNFNNLTITGDYTQSSAGRIEFGVVPGQSAFSDVLILSGSQISLAGELSFDPLADFTAVAMYGTSPLINGTALSTLTGVFDTVTGNVLGDGTGLTLTYTSTSVLLTRALTGDLNLDGFVGIADLNTVLGVWNQNVTAGVWGLGDPSGDGFIGIADLNIVLGNWNAGTPPADTASIPEPATGAGLLALIAVMIGRRTH